jgi:hypothetical protein
VSRRADTASADHACRISLGEARVIQGEFGQARPYVDLTGSWWPFSFYIGLDATLAQGATVGVQYRGAPGGNWQQVETDTGSLIADVSRPFVQYNLASRQGTLAFVPQGGHEIEHLDFDQITVPELAGRALEFIPYVRLPGGAVIFDHNLRPGDDDNYDMDDQDSWYAYGASCFHL